MNIPTGINYQAGRKRYQVRMTKGGKRIHIGRFKTLAAAKRALADAIERYKLAEENSRRMARGEYPYWI